jgi:hypothetical protein
MNGTEFSNRPLRVFKAAKKPNKNKFQKKSPKPEKATKSDSTDADHPAARRIVSFLFISH